MTPIIMTNEQRRMFYQMLKAVEELSKAVNKLTEVINNNETNKTK